MTGRTLSCLAQSPLLLAGGLAAGCSRAHEPTRLPPATPHASSIPTANVPALVGTSIDGLRRRLGAAQPLPAGFVDPLAQAIEVNTLAPADSQAAFRTGGLTLVASYNARTRQVRDLLLLGRWEDSLMGRASLQANSHDYLVLPVFRPDKPAHLMGLRVIETR